MPHFAALRGKEREIVILRSDNGDSWKEHTVDATEEVLNEVLHDSFEAEGKCSIDFFLHQNIKPNVLKLYHIIIVFGILQAIFHRVDMQNCTKNL